MRSEKQNKMCFSLKTKAILTRIFKHWLKKQRTESALAVRQN